jgi:hypothetical protein
MFRLDYGFLAVASESKIDAEVGAGSETFKELFKLRLKKVSDQVFKIQWRKRSEIVHWHPAVVGC